MMKNLTGNIILSWALEIKKIEWCGRNYFFNCIFNCIFFNENAVSANIKINWETNICYATLKEYRLNELNWILDYRGLSLNMLNCSWRWLQKPFIISERIFNSRSVGEWFEFTKIMVSRISASKLREWEINSSLRGWTRDPKSLMERINWSINLFFWSYVKRAEELDEEAQASSERKRGRKSEWWKEKTLWMPEVFPSDGEDAMTIPRLSEPRSHMETRYGKPTFVGTRERQIFRGQSSIGSRDPFRRVEQTAMGQLFCRNREKRG